MKRGVFTQGEQQKALWRGWHLDGSAGRRQCEANGAACAHPREGTDPAGTPAFNHTGCDSEVARSLCKDSCVRHFTKTEQVSQTGKKIYIKALPLIFWGSGGRCYYYRKMSEINRRLQTDAMARWGRLTVPHTHRPPVSPGSPCSAPNTQCCHQQHAELRRSLPQAPLLIPCVAVLAPRSLPRHCIAPSGKRQ